MEMESRSEGEPLSGPSLHTWSVRSSQWDLTFAPESSFRTAGPTDGDYQRHLLRRASPARTPLYLYRGVFSAKTRQQNLRFLICL